MASAVAGFMRTFGIDEPMGVQDDLEHADVFVLWGSNMAEMRPILWSRLTDRRLTAGGTEVHVLSTFEHRSFELADNGLVFKPQTDLAILTCIANHIIQNDAVNWDVVNKHTKFANSKTGIGYGLRPTHPLEEGVDSKTTGQVEDIDFDTCKALVAPCMLDYTAELSGVPADKLERLARAHADPDRKVMSLWATGFNQHTRGTRRFGPHLAGMAAPEGDPAPRGLNHRKEPSCDRLVS